VSEQVPERTAAPSSGGSMLTRKAGPLPVWGWLAIITAVGIGYWLLVGRKKPASSSGAATSGTGTETPSSDVPDYVDQTTVNVTEPAEPPQPSGPGPAPGPRPPLKKPTQPGKKTGPVTEPKPKPKTTGGGQPPIFSNSYTVKAGDTLDKLAAKFGISRVELAHANGLGTGAGLRTGQVLKVPGPLKPRSQGGPG
jgi:LysM repeat protein